MASSKATATIAAGDSVSTSIDLTAGSLAMILAPPDWTSANLSFQVSDDNEIFYDLIDTRGNEVMRTIDGGCAIVVDPATTQGAMYAKLRSGPRKNPVPQDADRVLNLIIN
jgi:hypothetical protein